MARGKKKRVGGISRAMKTNDYANTCNGNTWVISICLREARRDAETRVRYVISCVRAYTCAQGHRWSLLRKVVWKRRCRTESIMPRSDAIFHLDALWRDKQSHYAGRNIRWPSHREIKSGSDLLFNPGTNCRDLRFRWFMIRRGREPCHLSRATSTFSLLFSFLFFFFFS